MAAITHQQLVSHQDYSTMPSLQRLVRINENQNWITHYIDFVLTNEQKLIAKIVHVQSDFKHMPLVEVSEDKIYYLADRSQVVYESELTPGALPFHRLNKVNFISDLSQRKIEVVDIHIDHLHPATSRTYILMAPASEEPMPPLHFSPSASLPPETTPSVSEAPEMHSPYPRLFLEQSLEASPEPTPAPYAGNNTSPTAYQEFD